jgi:hypothetical protein
MRPHTLKLSLVVALSLVALAACDKGGKNSGQAAAPDTTNVAAATPATPAPVTTPPPAATPAPAPAAGGDVRELAKAMRLACADEIKKFCSTGGEKPGRCLKEHESELSPGCNSARQALRAARKAGKDE